MRCRVRFGITQALHVFALLVAGCTGRNVSEPSPQLMTCAADRPPADAAIVWNHDRYSFVSPRSLPSRYTGCQVMWNERGEPEVVLRFVNGAVTEYLAYRSRDERPSALRSCWYIGSKIAENSPAECPTYESINHGIRTVAPELEPAVPAHRDPRTHK